MPFSFLLALPKLLWYNKRNFKERIFFMSTKLKIGFGRVVCLPDDPVVHIAGNDAKTDMNTDGVRDDLARG